MTDLLTRIRAYVAAIPTHVCLHCDHEQTPLFDGPTGCERCGGSRITPIRLHEYDALLREVAALQPKAYLVHDGRMFVDAAYIKEDYALERVAQRKDGATLSKLYTFTGATHD